MAAGKLDRKIRLERATTTRDALGAPVQSWTTLAIVWAAYEPLRDSERYAADQVGATATARFRIRHSATVADLGPLDRLVFEGRTYDIHAVKEVQRRKGLEITAAARGE